VVPAIYWHATGLGEDLDRFLDRAEHFGIMTFEAMAFGCVPIVIRAGGQPEIVEGGRHGYLFADVDELKPSLAVCLRRGNWHRALPSRPMLPMLLSERVQQLQSSQ